MSRASLVALLIAFAPAAARAADPVQHINLPYPAKTPLVLQLNGIEQARERLTAMLTKAMPAEADKLNKQIDKGMADLLDGRKMTAIPKVGRVYLVVHDLAKLADEEPAVAVFVPVTAYKDFRDTFLTAGERKSFEKGEGGVDTVKANVGGNESTVFMVDLKEYVALTIEKGTADAYAAKFTRANTSAMGPDVAATFLSSDACLFVNMDAINDQFGEQIRGFKGLIDFAFNQAGAGGQIPGLSKKQLDGLKGILGSIFQGVEDCRALVAGVEFRADGLSARLQARFAPDTTTAGILKSEAPAAFTELASFPRGLTGYAGTKLGKRITDGMKLMAAEFAAADDDEEGAAAIDKLLGELAKAGPSSTLTATAAPARSLSVTNYKDAAKAAESTAKLFKTMAAGGKMSTIVLKDKPKVTDKAQSHRGFTFSEVRLSLDFDATVAALPEQVRESTLSTLKRVASEKMAMWVGTDGKVVASVTAKDWAEARDLLDGFLDGKGGVGGEAGYTVVRKNLPSATNYLSLSETGEMIQMWVDQLKAVGEAVPGLPPIGRVKAVKGDPTYMGVAITLKADTATFDGFVPGTALNVAVKMLMPLFKNIE